MTALPTLFLSHGAPTLAVEDSAAGRFLDGLAGLVRAPRAIVVASAHYTACQPAVGGAAQPQTVHDFAGFPATLYRLRYPAPGDPDLAEAIAARWRAAGFTPRIDRERGLDHGAWVPLLRGWPEAGVPVVPIAVDPRRDAAWHLALGAALAELREDGVLVIGSGGFVHNLGELAWKAPEAALEPWATAFADWFRDRLREGDREALVDWARQAPFAARAHPTTEHLLPLFVALGAAGESAAMRTLHTSAQFGSLALDAFSFG